MTPNTNSQCPSFRGKFLQRERGNTTTKLFWAAIHKVILDDCQYWTTNRHNQRRKRISWLKNLRKEGRTWFSQTTIELFRAAVNKVILARMIVIIRTE
jgi:hypothetical protein